MDCSDIQELLSAYYDGELIDDSRSNVDEHLDGCSECPLELAGFKELSAIVIAFSAPAHLWSLIEQQLDWHSSDEQPNTESADGSGRVCCQHGQAQSDSSMPYECFGECGGNNVPMAVDPAMGLAPSEDELAATAIVTIVVDAAADTASDSLRRTASTNATSGSQRCVLLCRYRL